MTAAYSTHASVSSSARFPSPSYRENGEHGIALVTGGHGYLDGQGRHSQPLAALDRDRVGERSANSRSRRPGRIGSGGEREPRSSASRERRQRCPSRQALELLTQRFDVGPVDRVRLPAPAVAVVGSRPGRPAVKMAARPVVTWSEAGRFVAIDEHRPRHPSFPR